MFSIGLARTHGTVQEVCLRLGEHEPGEQSMPIAIVVQENKKGERCARWMEDTNKAERGHEKKGKTSHERGRPSQSSRSARILIKKN